MNHQASDCQFCNVGLANAMREGENSKVVREQEVLKALGNNIESVSNYKAKP